ncbi:MAG: c-type cytochrome biogenesis protein CcsB [Candidatus Omnitrophica bacterium]|nr:c-type cytochrome biogenesis protein CcsB [Candidatus Omnitrophota bacterium]
MNTLLSLGAYCCCLLSAFFFVLKNFKKSRRWEGLGLAFFKAAFAFLSFLVLLRWYRAGRPPFANMYEALVLFAWSVALVYAVFEYLYKAAFLAVPANALCIFLLSLTWPQDAAIKPLMPALQSSWMAVHVVTYFIGYAALALAFVLSAGYLVASRRRPQQAPVLLVMDNLSYQLIIFAFPFITIGMTTGSAWANVAWGSYWFWDPKETCSLITWLVYAVYLHGRLLLGWKQRPAAWLSALGFLATLFTFVGVNYILPGLHSYTQ